MTTTTAPIPASRHANATATEVVLEARELRYAYGSTLAVTGLDLEVRRGELYALLGTNGAGKTTTLEILEGHRAPTSGRVRVLGADPRDRAGIRPRIGMMLQDSGLAPDLTAREALALAGAVSGRQDDPRRLLALVELGHRAGTRTAQLSGGERRRLDFAMAAWGGPELLFLDEPTTGLDPSARDALWGVVARLREEGATILLTTHYLEEAEANADRIGLMDAGALVREGTLAELADGASEIRFRAEGGAELPLPDAGVEHGTVVIRTTEPQRDLGILLAWASREGRRLEHLAVRERGLGEVFRELSR
ncbi:ABC transporter ATP-binding protein [Homoserinibacter sp. YIM 151385]|uniref:ABC transporter ATP-binding protein n=1 Tax=Homoserinibacter sp. YIM 151385 TaxID=2985506 RepID=UPI0022F10809|nr:ABC transporter ATP-binding protein [Homoserinibacter sp. YIM 151385]WBU38179.1 ABC transporter ATP-binding protein [Homoserinibacter sp. YIM 151385]